MARIPTNRNDKPKHARTCCQEFIIMVASPTPFTYCPVCGQWNEWDEVDGKPVVMSGLPRPRFRGPLGEQVELPQGTAERLENFEKGLRLAGFIGPREGLRQSLKAVTRFRVEQLPPREPSVRVQDDSSSHNVLRTSEATQPDDSPPNWQG